MTRIKTTDIKRQLRIRIATPEDAARLVAIYTPYVENTSITFEYIVPSAEEFADRIRHTLTRYPYLVAELGGEPAGYAYASAFKSRAAYDLSLIHISALLMTGLWRLPSMSAGIFEAAVSAVCYTKSWRNT